MIFEFGERTNWIGRIYWAFFLNQFLFFVLLSNQANFCIFLFSLTRDLWKKGKLSHHPDQSPLRLDPDLPLLRLDLAQPLQKLALVQHLPNQVNYINVWICQWYTFIITFPYTYIIYRTYIYQYMCFCMCVYENVTSGWQHNFLHVIWYLQSNSFLVFTKICKKIFFRDSMFLWSLWHIEADLQREIGFLSSHYCSISLSIRFKIEILYIILSIMEKH